MNRLHAWATICLLLSALLIPSGCSPTEEPVVAEVESCVEAWNESYARYFSTGDTYFLPSLSDDTSCEGLSWTLVNKPDGSLGELVQGGEFARFIPDMPGAYEFVLTRDGDTASVGVSLDAVDALGRAFHNVNYFPSPAVGCWVGEELWVAGVYTPQVARFDPLTMSALEPILVGPWPTALAHAESAGVVLVANKGNDTLGFIDVESRRQVDALWVGDEPTHIVWDSGRGLAYVALGGAGSLAVVDVNKRILVKTIPTVFDPLALAMHPSGETLVVASHRSGQSNLSPYVDFGSENEHDVAIVNLTSLEVDGTILEVASTIQAMHFDEEGVLWVTATTNNIEGSLNDPEAGSFQHQVFSLDVTPGPAVRGLEADLSRQESSQGSTATIHGFVHCLDSVWVAAEGSDAVLELNAELQELRRVAVAGRPRALVCGTDAVWAISSNRMEVSRVGKETSTHSLGLEDPRSQALRDGLEYFTGQGEGAGDNRACNSCHTDGLSDGVIWNAGPVPNKMLSRPFRWLEGTSMIGWDGYVGSVKISGYVGGSTINRRGTTADAKALGAYIGSLMPSPAANSLTRRDGSLSAEAMLGKSLFEGKGGCAGCHSGPKTTNQQVLENGITTGKTDVPTLVDVARIGGWYKNGTMASLRDTVADTSEKFGSNLTDEEIDHITRYLSELTGRDFFVLNADVGPDPEAFPTDGTILLTFSHPLSKDAENIARVGIETIEGESVDMTSTLEGRHLTLTPSQRLDHDEPYRVVYAAELESQEGRRILPTPPLEFRTASEPSLTLEGDYKVTVWVPMLNFLDGTFDYDNLVEQSFEFSATPGLNGAEVAIDYGSDLIYDDVFVLDGDRLRTKALPVSVGPSFLNGWPIDAVALDTDSDGLVDLVDTAIDLTGPGVDLKDIQLRIERKPDVFVCEPGTDGDAAPVVTQDGESVTIDWGGEGALALFVAHPEATLPLGPGVVQGGEAYWALEPESFPATFSGPVTYGMAPPNSVDASETHGAPLGGAELVSGECYRFSVVVNFAYSHTTILWP
jgi:hypothetical protein